MENLPCLDRDKKGGDWKVGAGTKLGEGLGGEEGSGGAVAGVYNKWRIVKVQKFIYIPINDVLGI